MALFETLRRSRWIALGLALSMTPAAMTGCAPTDDESMGADTDGVVDEIANVMQSAVKRQSIGNCWIYAALGWVESMNRSRTSTEVNYSESYLTFWDWYSKITSGSGVSSTTANGVTTTTIQTGGSWQLAVSLIKQRGLMTEGAFIPEESTSEMSTRQAAAQTAINTALSAGGELATMEQRRNGETVLRVLARAWNLRPDMVERINSVFGTRGEKRFDSYTNRATNTRTLIKSPANILVRTVVRSGSTNRSVDGALLDVLPGGRYAWRAVDYPGTWNTSGRPEAMRRMLRALNADAPVIVSWLVDFNALDDAGSFNMGRLRTAGRPGRQGGHLTVLHDYQVTLSGGRVLAAGQPASAADRELALNGTVQFLRVKNSWGVSRSDRASMAGYYDLALDYLHGPISWVNESSPMSTPSQQGPLNEMILPQGF